MNIELIAYASAESVTVNAVSPGFVRPRATASASLTDFTAEGTWYVNRVLVTNPSSRGSGLGTKVLQCLIREVKRLGGIRLVVEPGGYGADPEKQRNFYVKNGFTLHKDEDGMGYCYVIDIA